LARIGKNAFTLLAAQTGARLLNLMLTARLARALGVAALGRFLLALTVETIALAVADLGINVYTVRELAREFARESAQECTHEDAEPRARWGEAEAQGGDAQTSPSVWPTVLALKLLAALGCALALNIVVVPLFFSGPRGKLIAIVSLALLPDAFNGIVTSLIKARQRMEISSTIQLAVRLAGTITGIALLQSGRGEHAVLVSYVGASLLGSCAFVGVLWVWRVRVRSVILWRHMLTILRQSVPFAITGIVAILYSRVDLLMLAHWQGDLAAGLYGAASRVWEAIGMIPASLLDALFPELSRVSADARNLAHLRTLYRRGQMLVWPLIGLVVFPCFVLAPHLMTLLYGPNTDTAAASGLLRALLFAFPFMYLYLLNGHLLYAIGQQLRVTRTMIAATAANGLLNAVAIPRWSFRGAVGVAILTQILLYALLQAMAGSYFRPATAETGQMRGKESR
jgi:O-antigen/teichoic acid export membrane protein